MPLGLPPITLGGLIFNNPLARLIEVIGSTINSDIIVLFDKRSNIIKGALMGLVTPINAETFRTKVVNGIYS
jgi:hypothetical protein